MRREPALNPWDHSLGSRPVPRERGVRFGQCAKPAPFLSPAACSRPSPQYIVAAGILEPQADHALRAARFCLQIVGAAQMCLVDPSNPARGCLTVRVGMASGPAVGSCVSATRPKFTLVGDTVNTAARMVRLQQAHGHQSAVPSPAVGGRRTVRSHWPDLT